MLQRVIQFSVKNKLVIGLLMLLWVVFGSFQLTQLPIDAVPDITNDQVQVITSAPSLGAEDVERLITFPIELAISNIPGIKESRSMSRFGLSLITIVFEDGTDVYWARQQVSEKLSMVEITGYADTPQLAPITTGLGEIYQYVLRPQAGYEKKYSLAELRSIQDWLVRRQILGTKGVADVSTFGGDLKQYEVSVNPSRLKAMDLTIADVFNALSRNNQNTGGAYIEKGYTVLYIRSIGLTGSIDDINNIVVKSSASGIPVLIRHIADVHFGSAIRYGALNMAGIGEVTGGIVMMLKGGNSSEVVERVKARIAEVQHMLPEGLVIEPFLDRSKMVDNAIGTVERNLMEGALIVVFVLVLFLGNVRAGLIVASVIPLSMLFAVSMMNLLGVSGNLMSLGALDFGLIVDGAVIIVEAILHQLHLSSYTDRKELSGEEMNGEVVGSATRMMNAAVFGQIIILIVYLPILSLSGIEGKMFRPMAQTVGFAVLGAFILSLTYVPMISSLFISRKLNHKPTISDRMMKRIEQAYGRILERTLSLKKTIVIGAMALFGIALFLFAQMGGEFIPQLEEGDFAVETRLLVGTNLSTTIDAINRVSTAIQKTYPEVEKVVSRIGTAEIPTDPMPIEGGDMIVLLKDKSSWTSASSFAELAEKMAATAQEVLPGVTTSFQYPVQMRFNELMTGAKQDVVCKIFGEDLNQLDAYAQKLQTIARQVKGTADIYVEKVVGMPQVIIDYNRGEIARYGLTIEEVNRTINSAFAGAVAGKVYEGEKSFDLVVRVGTEARKDIQDVMNLQISTPGGVQIPLSRVADIKEIEGPNQIQRENGHRRIIVGFNVRGRDVESIVEELQHRVNREMKLAAGYSISYGGTFQNLQEAKDRLLIAVPVALLMIFMMLYFAFSSLKESALIYISIPLSAIGGVFALTMRGMPFSISAGVGFIALFGVAVLNGIVLITEFNRLQKEGADPLTRVLRGTRNRLRPVLMTASVASLGFLPMALSAGAGAEVQRPLATVVIGGLVTATLLTLFVLPAIYLLIEQRKSGSNHTHIATVVVALLMLSSFSSMAQSNSGASKLSAPNIPANANNNTSLNAVSLDVAISIAIKNNLSVETSRLEKEVAERLSHSGVNPNKATVSADYGQINTIHNDTRFGVSQEFSFPSVYTNQRSTLLSEYKASEESQILTEQSVRTEVRRRYYEYNVLLARRKLLLKADSLFREFADKSNLRLKAGEANVLESTSANTRRAQIAVQLRQLDRDLEIALRQFNLLLQDSVNVTPDGTSIRSDTADSESEVSIESLPQSSLLRYKQDAARYRWRTERARMFPDIVVGYNNQSLIGPQVVEGQDRYFNANTRFSYVNAGITLPLFFKSQSARIEASKLEYLRAEKESVQHNRVMEAAITDARTEIEKYRESLLYYEGEGLQSARTIIQTADQKFNAGDIDFLQWVILVEQSIALETEYINTLSSYNTAVINLRNLIHE
ncbi:CusA/CzcA family heavy metal efflux RND transporter [Chryseolinea sp. T2]|uniref:CusA/CzcA family heavy metal efflux RND transporter n=1 Tax=Chryseolinea sp. T2 TaxID=3129255 RepID=UPI00307803E1